MTFSPSQPPRWKITTNVFGAGAAIAEGMLCVSPAAPAVVANMAFKKSRRFMLFSQEDGCY
jgi:hypothetical protein